MPRPSRRSSRTCARGLGDPLLVVSDGAAGIIKAIEVCFPRSTRQRCLAHRMRNLAAKVPEDLWPEFKARATAADQAPSRKIARELAEGVVADYGSELANATACFMDDFEACIAHLRLPIIHRRATRTTNLLERLFVEERRRLKIIPNAFGEKAVLQLMFGAMTRAAERWRSIRVSEFERRQMTALRQELDHDYEATVDLNKPRPKRLPATKIPSNSRTWPRLFRHRSRFVRRFRRQRRSNCAHPAPSLPERQIRRPGPTDRKFFQTRGQRLGCRRR